jgi:hypothetical protein
MTGAVRAKARLLLDAAGLGDVGVLATPFENSGLRRAPSGQAAP